MIRVDKKLSKRNQSAALLAIGTEVTSGQILNRNAQWLSHHLEKLGFTVVLQMAVADDTDEILQALQYCETQADYIFTSGGLGPTSDDITRDVVSSFLEQDLLFDETSWLHINQMMSVRGRTPLESQRKQCYFPLKSRLFKNEVGTANAFMSIKSNSKLHLFVLPGPPQEIESIWRSGLGDFLIVLSKNFQARQLTTWNCMGIPEADLAEKVEAAVKEKPVATGYRLNYPYVEVKLWTNLGANKSANEFEKLVEEAISPWIVYKNDWRPWDELLAETSHFSEIIIHDELTGGFFGENFLNLWAPRRLNQNISLIYSTQDRLKAFGSSYIKFELAPGGTLTLERNQGQKLISQKMTLKSPFSDRYPKDRIKMGFAELAAIESLKLFSK